MNLTEKVNTLVQQVILKEFYLSSTIKFESQSMRDIMLDHDNVVARVYECLSELHINLDMYLLGEELCEPLKIDVKYPIDWWEAFKERWYPESFLRRWPVRYKEIKTTWRAVEFYPKMRRIPDKVSHLRFVEDLRL